MFFANVLYVLVLLSPNEINIEKVLFFNLLLKKIFVMYNNNSFEYSVDQYLGKPNNTFIIIYFYYYINNND